MTKSSPPLAEIYPALFQEWHPTKNGVLSPHNVSHGSGKKVWWLCKNGHEWEAFINNRVKGAGCPYCSGRYAGKENNLLESYPHIAKQWNYEKNKNKFPENVLPGSHYKAWWICQKGHEWQATVKNRVLGRGCPYCAKKLPTQLDNLAVLFPEIAEQWHNEKNTGFFPEDFRAQSNKKFWWRCGHGHEWQARIQDRTRGNLCPFCSSQTSQLEIRIYCELKTLFPNIVWRGKVEGNEIDIFMEEEGIGVEVDSYYWHRTRQKSEQEKQRKLTLKGIKLIRVREKPLTKIGEYDLLYTQKDSGKEILNKLLKTLLKFNHFPNEVLIKRYLHSETFLNHGEFKKVISYLPGPPPEKSLEGTYPNIAREWNIEENAPLLPKQFSPQSNKKVWWICKNRHKWEAAISTRTKGIGCPYCSGRLATNNNNLKRLRPDLVNEWHPTKNQNLSPENVTPFSHKTVWWLCKKGHEWQSTVADRAKARGCPFCLGRRVSSSNNLAFLHPELAFEWHPIKNGSLKPQNITSGSGKKVWWKCSTGHEWKAAIYSRVRGNGCPYCAGKLATESINLSSIFPKLAKEWHPIKNETLSPTKVRPQSNKKVWWKCSKGHEWEATINNRANGQGCPYCSGRRLPKKSYLPKS